MTRYFFPNNSEHFWTVGLDEAAERLKRENEANARLIAAAPDMLAALKELVRWHIKRGPFDEPLGESEQPPEINAAIAAISKAEGRPND